MTTPRRQLVPGLFTLLCFCLAGAFLQAQSSDSLQQRGADFYDVDQLDSARHYYQLALAIDSPDVQLRAYTSLMMVAIEESDASQADSLARLANRLLDDPAISQQNRDRFRRMKANNWSRNGDYRRGLDTLLKVAADQEASADKFGLATTLKDISLSYQRLILPDSSIFWIDRAHDALREAVDTTHIDYIYFLNDIGVVYYQADRLEEAEQFWLRNMAGLRANDLGQTQRMAHVYDNIANIATTRGEYDKTLDYRQRSLAISRRLGSKLDEAVTLFNIGVYHYTIGNFGAAATYVENSLRTREGIVGVGHPSLMNSYLAQAVLQSLGGQDDLAVKAYHRLLALVEANGQIQTDQAARFYDELGSSYRKLGQPDSSIYYFDKALRIFSANSRVGTSSQAISQYNYANVLADEKRYAEALAQIEAAITILEKLGLDEDLDHAQYLANYANQLIATGQVERAQTQIDGALTILAEDDGYKLGDIAADALGQLTKAAYQLYLADPVEANLSRYTDLEQAFVAVTERTRQQFHDPYTKATLNEKRSAFFEDNIDRYASLYQALGRPVFLERLFQLSELTKATTVRDRLRTGVTRFRGVPDSILARETAFQTELESLYYAASDANEAETDSLRDALFAARKAYDAFRVELAKIYPGYYKLIDDIGIPALSRVQSELGERGQSAVVYLKGKDNYYALVLNPTGAELVGCGPADAIESAVTDWRIAINSVLTADHLPAGHRLNQYLWSPLKTLLEHDRVKIVPDGALSSVSFDALSQSEEEPAYLIEDYALSNAYSLGLYLYQNQQAGSSTPGSLVGIAPGFSTPMLETYRKLAEKNNLGGEFLRVVSQPYALEVVRKIKSAFGGVALLERDATESRVRESFSEAKLLLFATHGFVNETLPLQSGMRLAPSLENGAESDEDGFLSIAEIFNSTINADLSILSLCESGVGKLTSGDGMLSLAYGFSYAGCASTINTLWQVDDRANSRLTENLLEHLGRGEDRAVALRNTKLNYLKEAPADLRHPYYWGALVVQGKDGPIALDRSPSNWWLWSLGALALLGTVVALGRKMLAPQP